MVPTELLDDKKNKAKLNLLREYPFEIAIVTLSICVVYLFIGQLRMTEKMQNYFLNDRVEMIDVIKENAGAMKESTEVTKEFKNLLYILNSKTNNRIIE